MIKQISFIFIGIIFSLGSLTAQTSEFPDSLAYKLEFSTYLSHTDRFASGFDIYSDKEGYTYISGNTKDKNFPATEGAYQTELKGDGLADVFVTKFSPKGEIVFATLLGGSQREHHTAITVDEQGFIYVAGGTESADFPVTEDAYDTSFNGEGEWAGDVFLTKLNPTGSEIIFSTFIGGEVEETISGGCLKLDSKGNIVLVGVTLSQDYPLTTGTIGEEKNWHGFVSKLDAKGEELLYSTVFGSSKMDMILGLDLDDKDNIYIAGCTLTADLPVTDNAFRKEFIEPKKRTRVDHYIAKITDGDYEISYLSYFGADGYMSTTLNWSEPNRLVVSGSTEAENFPVTDNAISKAGNGHQDCFISLFNSETMDLEYSTLFGGSEAEHVMSSFFLNEDTIVLGGTTNSVDFPLSDYALYTDYPSFEKTFNSTFFARKKSFISVIDLKKSKLLFSTYFGSCFLFNIYPDNKGNISFVAESGQRAEAGMTGFPTTRNAFMEPPTYTMAGRLIIEKPVDDAVLKSYVGEYELREGVAFTITKDGKQMKAQITGQDPFEIFPESETVFYLKITEAQITFKTNTNGEVDSMTFSQNGKDYECMKLED